MSKISEHRYVYDTSPVELHLSIAYCRRTVHLGSPKLRETDGGKIELQGIGDLENAQRAHSNPSPSYTCKASSNFFHNPPSHSKIAFHSFESSP